MSFDFQQLVIDDAMDAIIDYRGKTPKKSSFGIPLITAKIVKGGSILKPTEFIPVDNYHSWMVRGLPKVGDVVLTTEAPLGEVAQLSNEKVALAQRIVTLRGKKGLLHNDYLLYLLQSSSVQNQLNARATGTTVKGIKQSELRKVVLNIPALKYQKWAAKCLQSLDKKIKNNDRVNQTLEQMAQALFKSWFVDFEPVKAKMAVLEIGGSQEEATLAAMTAISGKNADALMVFEREHPEQYAELKTTAELFPSAMQESELGEIPEGWSLGALSNIAIFANGKVDISSLTPETYVSTENMLENRAGISTATSLPSVNSVPSFRNGHVLISNIRPYFKKIWLARYSGGRSADVLAFEAQDTVTVEYIYNLLYQESFFDFMMLTSKGVKMPRGDKTAIMGWQCICPDKKIANAFSKAVGKYYSFIEINNIQNKTLTQLRDTLLPKLLSGEITLPEAKQAVSEVEHV
ncbi:restriction endonuclease subunit S [Candidatus Symbiopectobacterium sp. NZEC135]|uniref:restriction endonuclease subunit S n=1 Tax=Candidatus Symbiopectobacterium sp. NZEC135 TaxID=2820471 RepID=UPI002225FAEB|nr:restriction endonuclease subunit S [Candidatus Symbiopectobacterium sp. NZEC135]